MEFSMIPRIPDVRCLVVSLALAAVCQFQPHVHAIAPFPEPAGPPVPGQQPPIVEKPLNRIENVQAEHGRLRVVAVTGARLRIRNPFILANPSRLVIDIADAKIDGTLVFTSTAELNGVPVNSLRVGQFSGDTVRVVVETPQPERFRVSVENNVLSLSGERSNNLLSNMVKQVFKREEPSAIQLRPPQREPSVAPQTVVNVAPPPMPALENLRRLREERASGTSDPARRRRIVETARAQLGLSKDAARDYINQTFSQGQDQEWCADFASTVLDWAGGSPWGHLSRVQDIYEWGVAGGRVTTRPEPGNLVVFSYGGGLSYDHVAFVESVNPDNTITTIGGNEGHAANAGGTGGTVARSVYKLGDQRILGFVDPLSPAGTASGARSTASLEPAY
jgi:surface antigen